MSIKAGKLGPYSCVEPAKDGRPERRMLTAEGRAFLDAHIEKYPNPVRVFAKAKITHSLYKAAIGCGMTNDDIDSLCREALVIAAMKFEPDRGYEFNTYSVWWMRSVVGGELDTLMRPARKGIALWGDSARETGDRTGLMTVEARPETTCHTVDRLWIKSRVDEALAKSVRLTAWREMFRMRHGLGEYEPHDLAEIASVYHASKEHVRRILNDVENMIYDDLEDIRDIWNERESHPEGT